MQMRLNLALRDVLHGVAFACVTVFPVYGEDLRQQAFAKEMAHLTKGLDVSVLVLSLDTGSALVSYRGDLLYREVPGVGSLIKPFTALAADTIGQDLPVIYCPQTPPGADGIGDCWYHPGHGKLGLVDALAESCNTYFFELARRADWRVFVGHLEEFGLVGSNGAARLLGIDSELVRREMMVGRNRRLHVRPVDVAYGLAALFNGGRLFRASTGGEVRLRTRLVLRPRTLTLVREGLFESAQRGTGRLVGHQFGDLYVKTGTDGVATTNEGSGGQETEAWCVAIAPRQHPALVVLVRVRPGRGATDAAPLAGQAIGVYLDLANPHRKE